ncbi:hypothetical protein [Serratia plymuthica]|uniref:GAPS4 PD-(D/E)XK nuclease domain-containing protein n=1 Tax=Serratia plymuthica TaxID=82996 RepID=A0A7T2WBA2_SERPL|nr:hypothetical protein [Serratia plymuthica]QPS21355.1 hypothetical protein I6G64_02715 [Serratia plymuthica]QPS62964.1 hypothetical protein I6G52_23460 [Serratia plymuthica]RKS64704.1 hypothetical protein C8E17_4038 [Serratia plymuthica]CAI2455670.1 Uncharacterised protein [Serratia plymuthica]
MGGETKNIDEIAGIISSRIFDELGWQCQKTTDISWGCCLKSHLSSKQLEAENPNKTHPTDVVFKYRDPYSDVTQYIQTDLKSYCASTLDGTKRILNTVRSLSQQVACAPRSPEWRNLFVDNTNELYQVHGMLFIYNHDNEYDSDLINKLNGAATASYDFPEKSMLAIFDPVMIRFLLDVTEHIETRRAISDKYSQIESLLWQKIPEIEHCSFFYPDKHNKIAAKDRSLPATIEMITSGMLFYEYKHDYVRGDGGDKVESKVLNIFWKENVNSNSHFVFLLEYIFNYQLLNQFDKIYIITPFSINSESYLQSAINDYVGIYSFSQSHIDTLKNKIVSIPFANQKLSIFEYQVASKYITRVCHFS